MCHIVLQFCSIFAKQMLCIARWHSQSEQRDALAVYVQFLRTRAVRVRPSQIHPLLTSPHRRLSPGRINVTGCTTPACNQERTCKHKSTPQPPAKAAVHSIQERWDGNHSASTVAPVRANIKGTNVLQIAIQFTRDQASPIESKDSIITQVFLTKSLFRITAATAAAISIFTEISKCSCPGATCYISVTSNPFITIGKIDVRVKIRLCSHLYPDRKSCTP